MEYFDAYVWYIRDNCLHFHQQRLEMLRKLKKIIERPKLEKDAVSIDDRRTSSIANSTMLIEPMANHQANEIVPRHDSLIHPVGRSDNVAIPSGHIMNAVQMQNIQNQSVYQFSNCTSLHFGTVLISGARNDSGGRSASKLAVTEAILDQRTPKKRIKTTSIDGEPRHNFCYVNLILICLCLFFYVVAAMMKCNDALEYTEMNIIAENLGQGWRDVIRELGFSDGKIEQLHEENTVKGIKEVIYQFLLDWTERDENATIGAITTLLWRNHWEVVYLLKAHWKTKKQLNRSESERSTE